MLVVLLVVLLGDFSVEMKGACNIQQATQPTKNILFSSPFDTVTW